MSNGPNIPRTEADLLRNLFQDGQANNSIGTHEFRDLIVSSTFLHGQGWEFDLDGQYTEANKAICLAGVRTQITIDGTLGNFGHPHPPEGQRPFWDVVDNKINPNGLNNFGIVRLALMVDSLSAPVNRFELELDVTSGPFPIIYQQTAVLAKGAGNPQSFNFTIPLFSGPDFQANGGKFFMTPLEDVEHWQAALTAVAVYIASPAVIIP